MKPMVETLKSFEFGICMNLYHVCSYILKFWQNSLLPTQSRIVQLKLDDAEKRIKVKIAKRPLSQLNFVQSEKQPTHA